MQVVARGDRGGGDADRHAVFQHRLETYRRMRDDMDVDAGRILEGAAEVADVGAEIAALVLGLAAGGRTRSEDLGHQEFILTYKSFERIGPACLA